jgi:hypothetical protein
MFCVLEMEIRAANEIFTTQDVFRYKQVSQTLEIPAKERTNEYFRFIEERNLEVIRSHREYLGKKVDIFI